MTPDSSRRGFLKGAAIAAGAAGLARVPGGSLVGRAEAAPGSEPAALVIVNLFGGYNSMFTSADSFLGNGAFGVTSTNIQRIGTSALYVDKPTLGTLSANTLNHMAAIGVKHGITSHATGQTALGMNGSKSRFVQMSLALGGSAAVRCVVLGSVMPYGTHTAISGVSLQQVLDLSNTISALGGTVRPGMPDRALAADGIETAHVMSKAQLGANPTSARWFAEGYPAATAQLREATVALNYAEMATAYGVAPNADGTLPTAVNSVKRQLMGAELMIRAGANVVVANQRGWDSHNDNNGAAVRKRIVDNGTIAALKVFTDRTLAMTNRNVVTVLLGEFARSIPGSNHQPNLTATVFGKYVKLGTTGRVNNDVQLGASTPGLDGLWAYLAAVCGVKTQPFGANPHNLVL